MAPGVWITAVKNIGVFHFAADKNRLKASNGKVVDTLAPCLLNVLIKTTELARREKRLTGVCRC